MCHSDSLKKEVNYEKTIIMIGAIALVVVAILAISQFASKDPDKTDVSAPAAAEENNNVSNNGNASSATQEITESKTTVNNDMLPLKNEVISMNLLV